MVKLILVNKCAAAVLLKIQAGDETFHCASFFLFLFLFNEHRTSNNNLFTPDMDADFYMKVDELFFSCFFAGKYKKMELNVREHVFGGAQDALHFIFFTIFVLTHKTAR